MVAAELAVFTQTQTCTGGRAGTRAVPRPGLVGARPRQESRNTRFPRRKAKGREGRKGQKERGKRTNIVGVVCLVLAGQFESNRDTAVACPLLAANPRTERSSDDVSGVCPTRERNPFDRREWGSKPGRGGDLDAAAGLQPPVATGSRSPTNA